MAELVEGATPLTGPPRRGISFPGRRTKLALLVTALVVLLLGGLVLLNKNAPPQAARLLPESDAIIYINVAPLRLATRFDAHPVKHDPEYQRFVDATGIQFERDLNQAAFALHRQSNPLGPNGAVAYSSIFVGKFDRLGLASYLERVAQTTEKYDGHEIYNVANEGRIDRVAILSADTVAVSNTPTAEQIHSILDRNRTAFLPFSSNTLLVERYRDVPVFSLAWGVGKLAAGFGDNLKIFGFRLPLSVDATFIASVRWAGVLGLRVEEIAPNSATATLSADSIEALLNIFRTAENTLPNALANPDLKALLDSVEVQHHKDRAVVTATVPVGLLQKLTTSAN